MVVFKPMLVFVFFGLLSVNKMCFAFEQVESSFGPQSQQSLEDEEIRKIGSIPSVSYVGGGIVGTWLGFGIGHGIQSRFSEKGYIFLTGELLTLSALYGSLLQCMAGLAGRCNSDSSNQGLIVTYLGLRIWEIIDLWYTPLYIDRHLDENKKETGPKVGFSLKPNRTEILLGWTW